MIAGTTTRPNARQQGGCLYLMHAYTHTHTHTQSNALLGKGQPEISKVSMTCNSTPYYPGTIPLDRR